MTKAQRAQTQFLSRYKRFMSRQKEYKWGPKYEPAIRAIRGEAPAISVASTLPSTKLQREVHALSNPEKFFLALALYNPNLWELHEQHLLYPGVRQHPLSDHKSHSYQDWPSTTGTLRIAKRLGFESQHPSIWIPDQAPTSQQKTLEEIFDDAPKGKRLAFPYVGDSLLFLRDELGPYLLSWDVKQGRGDHGKPGGPTSLRKRPGSDEKAFARDAIYHEYMNELGVRVVRVSLDEIPSNVAKNLLFLCLTHSLPVDLPYTLIVDLIGEFQHGLTKETAPIKIINQHVRDDKQFICAKNLLQIAVWERKLRVDLQYPVLVDAPLVPETQGTDLLEVYKHLFAR